MNEPSRGIIAELQLPPRTIQQAAVRAASAAGPVAPPVFDRDRLDRIHAVRDYTRLVQRSTEMGSGGYLVETILPKNVIGILVGDSGLGKSPLLYQMGICVAAGVPFLGNSVRQGRVLYLDYENGLGDSAELIRRLAQYLGLAEVPADFLAWNLNDCSPSFDQPGHTALDIIRQANPCLSIIDSLGAYMPLIEDKNSTATSALREFRQTTREGTTILAAHHIRKPSNKPDEAPSPLGDGNIRSWFLQARGARALINGSDIRLGVDTPGVAGDLHNSQSREQIALVMRGFGRVRGEIGPVYLARVSDDEGEALGYRPLGGHELLFNSDQQRAFLALPPAFSFADAKRIYGRSDQPTADFLQKCARIRILKKIGRGRYEKVEPAE